MGKPVSNRIRPSRGAGTMFFQRPFKVWLRLSYESAFARDSAKRALCSNTIAVTSSLESTPSSYNTEKEIRMFLYISTEDLVQAKLFFLNLKLKMLCNTSMEKKLF